MSGANLNNMKLSKSGSAYRLTGEVTTDGPGDMIIKLTYEKESGETGKEELEFEVSSKGTHSIDEELSLYSNLSGCTLAGLSFDEKEEEKEEQPETTAPAPAPEPAPEVQPAPAPAPAPAAEPMVVVTRTGKKYHNPGCRYVTGKTDTRTIPLSQAKAEGYTPCSVCGPPQ
ncbi:MAG: hypothetical protein KJ907_07065 [Actinobacteria bacterium]|nr:hypothetical protein [Actinomycetota bacterium]MBU4442097.1 hypothetical protein [Actinomycetota bacterium]